MRFTRKTRCLDSPLHTLKDVTSVETLVFWRTVWKFLMWTVMLCLKSMRGCYYCEDLIRGTVVTFIQHVRAYKSAFTHLIWASLWPVKEPPRPREPMSYLSSHTKPWGRAVWHALGELEALQGRERYNLYHPPAQPPHINTFNLNNLCLLQVQLQSHLASRSLEESPSIGAGRRLWTSLYSLPIELTDPEHRGQWLVQISSELGLEPAQTLTSSIWY